MIRFSPLYLFIVVAAFALQSCNDDIFISESNLPVDLYGTVEGDGGSVEFDIITKDLLNISLDRWESGNTFTYYNSKGEIIPEESPASELARIEYTSPWFNYEVLKDGNKIKINTFGNSDGSTLTLRLRLDYTYTATFIEVQVMQGEDAELVDVDYSNAFEFAGNRRETRSLLYNNNTENVMEFSVIPYLYYSANYLVEPVESWARYKLVEMRIPAFTGGEWGYGPLQLVRLAASGQNTLDYAGEKVPVSVKPFSSAKIISVVTLEEVRATGLITLRNPVTKQVYTTHFTTTVLVPVDYEINVNYLP